MAKYVTGTREEWLAARLELLRAEKEYSRQGDELVVTCQNKRYYRAEAVV
jgi:predicted dithiol-disulfide oxidoreductase (DUF899 family)